MLVFVPYHKADAATRGTSLKDAGEQFHLVTLFAGRSEYRLSRFASVQLLLDKIHIHLNTGRYAINHSTDAFAV